MTALNILLSPQAMDKLELLAKLSRRSLPGEAEFWIEAIITGPAYIRNMILNPIDDSEPINEVCYLCQDEIPDADSAGIGLHRQCLQDWLVNER